MASVQGKRRLIVVASILGLILLSVITIIVLQNINKKDDQAADTATETSQPAEEEAIPSETEDETAMTPETPNASVDPATLNTIDIEPLEITVAYSKGVRAFEYEVLRTSSGTKYVDFSSPELVGTKCTDDTGVFASIIQGVKSEEDNTTISQTVEVGGTTYGLSLTGDNCASDVAVLKEYQTAFSNGFSQLKEME